MKWSPVLLTMTFALASTAIAHQGVQDPTVKERMDGMSAMGRQVKVIGEMAKGNAEFDAAVARAALERIAARAAATPELFEEEADDPKSEALPIIWEEFDEFAEIAGELEATASSLAGSVSTREDLPPALRKLGSSC